MGERIKKIDTVFVHWSLKVSYDTTCVLYFAHRKKKTSLNFLPDIGQQCAAGCPAVMHQRADELWQKSANDCAPRLVWCAAQVSPSGTSVCSQCSDLFTRRPASSAGSETPGSQQFGGLNDGTHDRRFGLAVFRDMPQNLGCHFLRRPSSRSIAPVLRHRREYLDSKAPTQAGVLISRKA
ncbi:hypothetical protein Veis_1586 [Verminephrobacter eiseniae EF01-2]|uniref:Uncharacterized protein n=1 Tax=Verminephrobacter eiseniae (strain EF01-2) TaxID=391735 RepID=A1WI88_VEREI|nr:hypothetical protein Veis_1586 [Verminephrobacter eiseniae EF01-2]